MHAVDVHAHWYPRRFLELIERHGAEHGIEWQEVQGKGPQFKCGHLVTGPLGANFVDLEARLRSRMGFGGCYRTALLQLSR